MFFFCLGSGTLFAFGYDEWHCTVVSWHMLHGAVSNTRTWVALLYHCIGYSGGNAPLSRLPVPPSFSHTSRDSSHSHYM
jgi:hypothetical protein